MHIICIKQQGKSDFAHISLVSCKSDVLLWNLMFSSIFLMSCEKWYFSVKNHVVSLSSSPLALLYVSIPLRLFQHRKCFSVSDRNTALRRYNAGPVLPSVPWGFVEYEPGPKRRTSTVIHTQTHEKTHPSSSIPLSPALTSHLNSKVRLFISLPHPIKPSLYKRTKPSLASCCWRIRAEVETAASDVLQPYHIAHQDVLMGKVTSQSPSQ